MSDQKTQKFGQTEAPTSSIESGMLMMATGVMMAPGVHAIAKGLGDALSPAQISFSRFFIQFLFLLPLVWLICNGRIPRPTVTHMVRGMLLAAATLFFFWALTRMPLAESSAIFFVEPLILTIMSAVFLGEPIGRRRIIAVVVGFVGALIVIRPNFQVVGPVALLPLLSAACIAIYLTITRSRAQKEDARVMQFWVCLFAAMTLFLTLCIGTGTSLDVIELSWVTGRQWLVLAGLGAIATISHMLAIYGIRQVPAAILAPFQYLEILGATVLGVLFFNDLPDGPTLIGIIIIVGSGLYVFRKERMAEREASNGRGLQEPR